MLPVTIIIWPECPYCTRVLRYIEELKLEYTHFAHIPITILDESRDFNSLRTFHYFLVPCIYVDKKKLFEGPVSRQDVFTALTSALQISNVIVP